MVFFMKTILLGLVIFFCGVNLWASHSGEFSIESIDFANKLILCPKEVLIIMTKPDTRIVEASYSGDEIPGGKGVYTEYVIQFEQTASSFRTTRTTLSIGEKIIPLDTQALDALDNSVEISCNIIKEK